MFLVAPSNASIIDIPLPHDAVFKYQTSNLELEAITPLALADVLPSRTLGLCFPPGVLQCANGWYCYRLIFVILLPLLLGDCIVKWYT